MIIDSSSRDRVVAWLRLTLVPGVSASVQRALMTRFGGAIGVARAAPSEIASQIGDPVIAGKIVAGPDAQLIERTLQWIAGTDCHFIAQDDPLYPLAFRTIDDAPVAFYARGSIDRLQAPAFAIVGSRNATPQGVRDASELAHALSDAGLVIVSGLALGIDAAAHRGGLAGASGTVAVMGTGPDILYPPRNRPLAEEIARGGCLITEFPLGIAPVAGNFPRRNRLISGLSKGVLVVEAAMGSGSLLTAKCALEQNRDVFAMPGSVHSPVSKGCHWLIREGAKLVETADDVLCELGMPAAPPQAEPRADLPADTVIEAMGHGPVTFDEMATRTGMGAAALASHLSCLQIAGRIAALPGGRFQRVENAVIE